MTNEADAAPAAAEPFNAPEADVPATETNAVEETPRGAIDRAFEAVDAMDDEGAGQKPDATKAEAEPDAKAKADKPGTDKPEADGKPAGERERNPDGTFKAKDADDTDKSEKAVDGKTEPDKDKTDSFNEAPNRFSADAKTAWKDAPLPVRAEIRRMEREFEAGIEKYRGDAEAFGEYKEFAEHLKTTGQTFESVLNHYTGIESLLARDRIAGFELIARNLGTDFQTIAAEYLNRAPDEVSQAHNSQITSLHNEIADLKKQLGGVTTTIADERKQAAMNQIDEFSANNPRFDELSADMALLMQSGRASGLQEAYDLAGRLNPAPAAPSTETNTAAAQTRDKETETAQTRKGQLSVTGAPGDGSNPSTRKPPATARDAIDMAFDQVGIG